MKKILLFSLSALLYLGVNAQTGVSINNTGAVADGSAMLDVSSTTTGFLFPRMTEAQRDAIVLPATGLMIFQIDQTAGVYLNGGTPAAPNWLNASGANSINDLSDARVVAGPIGSYFIGGNTGLTATGNHNIGFGNLIFGNLTTGESNIGIGNLSLNALGTGQQNVAIGVGALVSTTGSSNIAIGSGAGQSTEGGSGNILIGTSVNASSASAAGELNLGRIVFGTDLGGSTAKVGIGYDHIAPNSTLDVAGSMALSYDGGAATITLDETHYVYGTQNLGVVNLPTAVGIDGRVYIIKMVTTGTATVNSTGGEIIDISPATSYSLTAQGKYVRLISNGAAWLIIGQN